MSAGRNLLARKLRESMARPKLEINESQVESLAAINCTMDEIASVIGCSKDTLERRFAAVIKKGRENGKSSLRRKMWELAQKGNVTMCIWLSKQLLGYTDKVEQKNEIKSSSGTQLNIITLPQNGFESPKNELIKK